MALTSATPQGPSAPQPPLPGPQPEVEEIPNWHSQLPKSLQHTRRYGGQLCLAGQGKIPADIMFVQTAVTEHETAEVIDGAYGPMPVKPRYLRGPAGCILKDILASLQINIDDQYYTTLVKWCLPRQERMKPKRPDIQAALPILDDEIQRVKPKIIVTFGKPAFEAVLQRRLKFDDVRAGWFWSERYQAKVFVMQDVVLAEFKPEMVEKYRCELAEVQRMYDETRGVVTVVSQPPDYQVISNSRELEEFARMLAGEKKYTLSVDAEFGGRNFIDGYLRSLQVGFENHRARYIRFMNDRREYVFDVPYRTAGSILQPHFDDPRTKYVGYHISVDLPWMHHWLGLEWYRKCFMDCEYAEQVLDENTELGLERLALKYTTLGRYDIELVEWKAANPDKVSDELGYLLVPDEILVPYGCKDVDGPFQAAPIIAQRLMWDGTWDYYCNYRHHLVTDIFTQFALQGMPCSKAKMDDLRDLYQYSRELLERRFVREVANEARGKLLSTLMMFAEAQTAWDAFNEILTAISNQDPDRARSIFKKIVGAANINKLVVLEHFIDAPAFNLRSSQHKSRWLFDVKEHKPVKSTNNKDKGLPSIPWERVENMPPNVRRLYTPATDKQSLKIIADDTGDPLVNELMDVLAVGNVCKAFLKEAEIDDETGELIKENGLHYWLASDLRIHGQYSVTETGRPRSWKPNQLNWPSYVHKGVQRGIAAALKEQKDMGQLPERFEKFLVPENIPSIRSVIDVVDIPPVPGSVGWCLVESDYQTAEIRGLAFLSGDDNLIRLVTAPDEQFGVPLGGNLEKDRVRLRYDDDCGIPEANRRMDFIGKQAAKGKIICEVPLDKLIRNPDGTLYHPPHDLHWSLVEWVMEQARELFDEKVERTGTGKVGNFSSAYGATAQTLERKIKADTGKTPPEGTGQRILDALRKRQPVATAWLEMLAALPETQGWWQAESGAKRRFVTHRENVRGLSSRARKGIYSTLGREARNFPMQNSVADTAVRAGTGLLEYYRTQRLYARPMAILYDSCVTLCPIEERFIVLEAHDRFMTRENNWHNHGRTWNYPSSHEFNYAWSARPTKAQQALLDDKNWNAKAPWLGN